MREEVRDDSEEGGEGKDDEEMKDDGLERVKGESFEGRDEVVGRDIPVGREDVGDGGTKAPQRKLLPRATTFVMPLIALRLRKRFAIRKARAVAQSVKTKEFRISQRPWRENITGPTTTKLIRT